MSKDYKIPVSAATKAYQDAMAKLSAGDLTSAVKGMLRIHSEHTSEEEAYFVEEQLARVRRMWPAEAEKAGLTAEAWNALQERARARRAGAKLSPADTGVVVLLLVIGAWSLLVAVAPRAAFVGRLADVPLIFRLVGGVVGLTSAATAFGLMKMKWEAVNLFIILSPIFMVATFIGMTEAAFMAGKIICGVVMAAEALAAWYMSKQARRFIY